MAKTPKKEGSAEDVSDELAANVDELLRQAIAVAPLYISRVSTLRDSVRPLKWELVSYEIKECLYRTHTASGKDCSPQLLGHADLTLEVRDKSPHGSLHRWRYIVAPKNAGLAATFQRLQQIRAWVSSEVTYDIYNEPMFYGLVTDDVELNRLASEQGYQVLYLSDGKLQTDDVR